MWNEVLDLLLTNAFEMIGDIRYGGCLGCSDHAIVEFTISSLSNMRQTKSKIKMLNFRKDNYHFFRELVKKPPGELSSRTRERSRFGRSLR